MKFGCGLYHLNLMGSAPITKFLRWMKALVHKPHYDSRQMRYHLPADYFLKMLRFHPYDAIALLE